MVVSAYEDDEVIERSCYHGRFCFNNLQGGNMGSEIGYKLKVVEGDKGLIKKLIEYDDDVGYYIDDNGDQNETGAWYNDDEVMRKFSKMHPKALFELHYQDYENVEQGKTYFKDGKSQQCNQILMFPAYDPAKMK